jgi:hypothetical protein
LGQEIKVAGGVRTNFGDPTPKVASLADGGFVIVWITAQYSNTVLFGQRYSSTGVAVGGITEIAKGQSYRGLVVPNAVGLKDGGFVVTWGDYSSPYPKNPNSFGQRFIHQCRQRSLMEVSLFSGVSTRCFPAVHAGLSGVFLASVTIISREGAERNSCSKGD